MFRKIVKFFLILILILLICEISTVEAQEVSIPDAVLKSVIRSNLGLQEDAPITREAMRGLGGLTDTGISPVAITNLIGLEHATNMEGLYLPGHQINDLRPIARLTNLLWIDLKRNQISDVGPLAGLTNLWGLELQENQISDVTPLAGLVELETLYLAGNPLRDTSPLADLYDQLIEKDFEITRVVDRTPLDGVSIPDPALEQAIRNALGLSAAAAAPLTGAMMQALVELDAPESGHNGPDRHRTCNKLTRVVPGKQSNQQFRAAPTVTKSTVVRSV